MRDRPLFIRALDQCAVLAAPSSYADDSSFFEVKFNEPEMKVWVK